MIRINPFRIREDLPGHARWLMLFQALNAVNFTIALGAPMVLTARYLGADESILGLLISLTPFLATLQIIGTGIADRWGYRKLMIVGWASRAFMLLPAMATPLLIGRFAPEILVWIFFAALFAFNAIRGVSGCAWFPWLKLLIPEKGRGYYLGMEQRAINFCVLMTLIVAGSILAGAPAGWHYSIVFCISWAAGICSAYILAKVPDRRPSDVSSREPLGLKAMRPIVQRVWAYKPYRRIIRFGVLHSFAYMAFPGFLVLYLRNEVGWTDGIVLIVSSAMTLGIMLTSVTMGQLSDRVGSRPLMRLATLGMMGVLAFWILCTLGVIHPGYAEAGLVYLLSGFLVSAQTVPQIRLALASCPGEEITVGVMIYQVALSLSGGIAPMLWGFALKAMRPAMSSGDPGVSYPFTVLFGFSLFLLAGVQVLLSRIPEPKAMPTGKFLVQMFWGWPLRVLSAFSDGRNSGEKE